MRGSILPRRWHRYIAAVPCPGCEAHLAACLHRCAAFICEDKAPLVLLPCKAAGSESAPPAASLPPRVTLGPGVLAMCSAGLPTFCKVRLAMVSHRRGGSHTAAQHGCSARPAGSRRAAHGRPCDPAAYPQERSARRCCCCWASLGARHRRRPPTPTGPVLETGTHGQPRSACAVVDSLHLFSCAQGYSGSAGLLGAGGGRNPAHGQRRRNLIFHVLTWVPPVLMVACV